MKRYIYIIIFFAFASNIYAQSSFENFIKQVKENNKQLKALRFELKANEAELSQGIWPEDPSIEAEFMKPEADGVDNRYGFGIKQGFDFPTSYIYRNAMTDESINKAKLEYQIKEKEILEEAALSYTEYLYLLKKTEVFQKRMDYSNTLKTNAEKKFKAGEISIIELNKAKLDNAKLKNEMIKLNMDLNREKSQLEILLSASISSENQEYPKLNLENDFNSYYENLVKVDPEYLIYKSDYLVAKNDLSLSKSMWLPKFELGLGRENEEGVDFTSFSIGMSIPIFENRYNVDRAEFQLSTKEMEFEYFKLKYRKEKEIDFQLLKELKDNYYDYSSIINSENNVENLKKSVDMGNISTTEYYIEQDYYYEMLDEALEMEKNIIQNEIKMYSFLFLR